MDFPKQNKRLLDQVTDKLRLKHYGIRTGHSYISWIKRYIYFHRKQPPATLGREACEFDHHVQTNWTFKRLE